MTLHDKLVQAVNNRDIDAYLNLLHEEFTVTFHKSGNSLSKEEWASMATEMLVAHLRLNLQSLPLPNTHIS